MFDPVRGKPDLPATEASIGRFWRDAGIYRKSLDRRRGGKRFVFFEGPPTANGMPHPGHCPVSYTHLTLPTIYSV